MGIPVSATPRPILGMAESILRGETPVAIARFVERPDLAHHVASGSGTVELALHLRPATITPVKDARAAGQLVSDRARALGDAWHAIGDVRVDDRFPFQAALMAQDGQWYVASLAPHLDGAPVPHAPTAGYALNNGLEPVMERSTDTLRMVSHDGYGFTFRRGSDMAVPRRKSELPQTVLGDGYQPAIIDTRLQQARDAMPALVDAAEQLAPKRHGLELRPTVRVGDRAMMDLEHARYRVRTAMTDALYEMDGLLPDELTALPLDEPLRRQVAEHRAAIAEAVEQLQAVSPNGIPSTVVDHDALRASIESSRRILDAIDAAPVPAARDAVHTPFDALVDRFASGNMLSRDVAMRGFEYDLFGRTRGERMRNFAVAWGALEDTAGFTDRSVGRIKAWLRDLAADAAAIRAELPEDRQHLAPLLDAVVENGTRNGRPGVVVNAQGVLGYDVYPDFGEVGRMSAALRTYLHVDDATGAARLVDDVPVRAELLDW